MSRKKIEKRIKSVPSVVFLGPASVGKAAAIKHISGKEPYSHGKRRMNVTHAKGVQLVEPHRGHEKHAVKNMKDMKIKSAVFMFDVSGKSSVKNQVKAYNDYQDILGVDFLRAAGNSGSAGGKNIRILKKEFPDLREIPLDSSGMERLKKYVFGK